AARGRLPQADGGPGPGRQAHMADRHWLRLQSGAARGLRIRVLSHRSYAGGLFDPRDLVHPGELALGGADVHLEPQLPGRGPAERREVGLWGPSPDLRSSARVPRPEGAAEIAAPGWLAKRRTNVLESLFDGARSDATGPASCRLS